ncbi:MAG TPA: hypothetical protein VIH92_15140 [Solirubrobacteraceae bacterium]
MSDAAAGADGARGGAQTTAPGSDPLARIVFAVIVLACFAAFLITQRLKHTPTVVQEFKLTPYFSPYPSGREKQAEISFKLEHAEDATVTIINSAGNTVATLVHDYPVARYHTFSLRWNGRRGSARRLQRTLTPHGLAFYTPLIDGAIAPAGEYRVRVALQHHKTVLSPLDITLVGP